MQGFDDSDSGPSEHCITFRVRARVRLNTISQRVSRIGAANWKELMSRLTNEMLLECYSPFIDIAGLRLLIPVTMMSCSKFRSSQDIQIYSLHTGR